jgi:mitogen-activated protein kinase 1/3
MLVYDPKARFTAEECLNHPFLEEYRNRPRLKCREVFDFSFDKIEMTMDNLRKAIYEEVESFQERKKRKVEGAEEGETLEKKVKLE